MRLHIGVAHQPQSMDQRHSCVIQAGNNAGIIGLQKKMKRKNCCIVELNQGMKSCYYVLGFILPSSSSPHGWWAGSSTSSPSSSYSPDLSPSLRPIGRYSHTFKINVKPGVSKSLKSDVKLELENLLYCLYYDQCQIQPRNLRRPSQSDYTQWKMNLYVLMWRSQVKIRRPKSPKLPLDLTLIMLPSSSPVVSDSLISILTEPRTDQCLYTGDGNIVIA